jgi:MYXO-CTERM domain-containing protein
VRALVAAVGTALGAALTLTAASASANGRLPAANQLVVAPSDPTFMALRATFGIIISHDGGQSWYWICESATGYDAAEIQDPSIGITANNSLVVGLREGLAVSHDNECDWHYVSGPLGHTPIIDVVTRPDMPSTILALSSVATGTDDAGDPTYTSQVWTSTDNGETWAMTGTPLPSSYILETIEVAATDDQRIYVSGVTGAGSTAVATMFVSSDGAMTWTPRSIPAPTWDTTNDTSIFVSAVDPTDEDLVYIRTIGSINYKLIVSNDAGQTYYTAFEEPHNLTGFALSADGTTVYVGGPSVGLFTAPKTQMLTQSSFTATSPQNPIDMTCLARNGTALLACSAIQSGPFLLGQSVDNGATFTSVLQTSQLCGPLTCITDAAEYECNYEWPIWMQTFDISGPCGSEPNPDSGSSSSDASVKPTHDASPDASSSNDAGGGGGGSSGCGCDTATLDAGGIGGLGALIGAMALMLRRRRNRS